MSRELNTLRYSLRRIAEIANEQGAKITIPINHTERGWNTLCLDLINWLEYMNQQKKHWNRSDDG